MNKYILAFILIWPIQFIVYAQPASYQQGFPTVGYKCPDAVLQNIKYWHADRASISSFRGKWLILDFFNRQCGACAASFPHMDSISKEYKDKMEVMMIGAYRAFGRTGEREKTIAMYESYRQKENLSMPVAFDSALAMKWDIYAAPYIIIIDDKGTVKAITTGFNRQKLDSLMDGYSPVFHMPYRWHQDLSWREIKPYVGEFSYDSEIKNDIHKGPRFAIQNDAPFPMIISFDNPGTNDSLNRGQMSKFYEGDYRLALQITNIYFNMQYGSYRGKTCAFRYKPAEIKNPLPNGDWVIHFYYKKGWRFKVVRIEY